MLLYANAYDIHSCNNPKQIANTLQTIQCGLTLVSLIKRTIWQSFED